MRARFVVPVAVLGLIGCSNDESAMVAAGDTEADSTGTVEPTGPG